MSPNQTVDRIQDPFQVTAPFQSPETMHSYVERDLVIRRGPPRTRIYDTLLLPNRIFVRDPKPPNLTRSPLGKQARPVCLPLCEQ